MAVIVMKRATKHLKYLISLFLLKSTQKFGRVSLRAESLGVLGMSTSLIYVPGAFTCSSIVLNIPVQ